MRLLNTQTYEFAKFEGENIPSYAILSHTWGSEETSFANALSGCFISSNDDHTEKPEGVRKVIDFCNKARITYKLKYAWVDTCCINKDSSAELSEAINSMFKWYQMAEVCLVHLADIGSPTVRERMKLLDDGNHMAEIQMRFVNSRWFSRAWCLQELIAPRRVLFFDANWEFLGTRLKLRSLVETASGISIENIKNPMQCSIAMRFSWASKRAATRPEDIAYALMGLFGINMPLLYGEGEIAAFYRLQCEIIKVTNDESIFAWSGEPWLPGQWHFSSLLAHHPSCFQGSKDVQRAYLVERGPYYMTHAGLQMKHHFLSKDVLPRQKPTLAATSVDAAVLNCREGEHGNPIIIFLVDWSMHNICSELPRYRRTGPHMTCSGLKITSTKEILVDCRTPRPTERRVGKWE